MSRYRSRTRLAALLSAAGGGGPLLGQDAIDNMISWWKLDEESGVRADAHGSQDLTDGNTVLYGTGKQGNAALFNKVNNESLSIGNGAGNRLATGDFTVWGWFNSGVPSGTCPLFFKKFEYLVEFQNSNNRTPKVQLGSGGGWTTGGPVWGTALNLDTWYFICAWHDVSAKTLYLQINDGTPVSGVYTGTGGNSTNTMYLAFQDSAKDFGGLMDEFGISRTILTAADRAALYNLGAGITYEQATGA